MAKVPAGWDAQAHALWQAGRRQEAVQRALEPLNALGHRPTKALLSQFAFYLFLLPDYAAAAHVLERASTLFPDDLLILINLAIAQSRARQSTAAIATVERYLARGGKDATAFDTLATCFYRLGRLEEARTAGEKALALKDEQAEALVEARLDPCPDDLDRRPKVIAFSLWGANPRYLRGALHNAVRAGQVYPGWTCRFYVDSSVPADITGGLAQLGAEIVECDTGGDPQRLCRRFLVSDDKAVGRFLVRDCDSVVTRREAVAVAEWIASGKPFHVMRDWWTHTDPILAGMWGGIAGVLPRMEPVIAAYRPRRLETPSWDQWLLRDRIWPLIRDEALIHDRCFRSRNAVPFPGDTPSGVTHVGQDEFAVRRDRQKEALARFKDSVPSLQLQEGR